MTRGKVYNEILPKPEGFLEGSGNTSSYTPTWVTIQSFSIASTSQYFLVLAPWAGPIRARILPRECTDPYWASLRSQYKKILKANRVNTRKYWLLEVIEYDCIVTQVGVYDEILHEPSGNPSGLGNISSYTTPLVTIQLQYIADYVNSPSRIFIWLSSCFFPTWTGWESTSRASGVGSTRSPRRNTFEWWWGSLL